MVRFAVLAGALALAAPAFGQPADCSALSNNVLRFENCGFDSGISAWSLVSGTNPQANSIEGNPSPGSYQAESLVDSDGDRATTIVSPCIPIATSSDYGLEAQYMITDPTDAVSCGFFVAGYADSRCTGPITEWESVEVQVTGAGWVELSDTFASRSSDRAIEIYTFCFEDGSGPVFTMLMDNFVANGPVSRSPIFSNGFESGDTSAWSRTVR